MATRQHIGILIKGMEIEKGSKTFWIQAGIW
jgi:hypothetical protein